MRRRKTMFAIGLFLMGLLGLWGCSSPSSNSTEQLQKGTETALVYESSMELEYAENFTVDHYKGGYTMLTTTIDKQRFLIVPKGKEIPEHLDEDIVVLKRPMKDIYLVASAVMDMFSKLDGLDAITFSGQKEENWYIKEAKEAGAFITFDPNLREPLWNSLDEAKEQIAYGMSQCDLLKISDNELQWFTGKEDFDEGIAYLKEDTIETTGAGDTFCGCIISFIINHLDNQRKIDELSQDELRDMLVFANAAASIITTKKGALRVMPTKEEIESII